MARKHKKVRATSVMPICIVAGIFLGFTLGALMDNLLLVTVIGTVLGVAAGWYFDKRNGVSYGRRP